MDKYSLLMQQIEKAQADIDADKISKLTEQSQYTQARKTFDGPVLRLGETEPGQYAADNYPNGFNIQGWEGLKETPKDKLLKLLNKKK